MPGLPAVNCTDSAELEAPVASPETLPLLAKPALTEPTLAPSVSVYPPVCPATLLTLNAVFTTVPVRTTPRLTVLGNVFAAAG